MQRLDNVCKPGEEVSEVTFITFHPPSVLMPNEFSLQLVLPSVYWMHRLEKLYRNWRNILEMFYQPLSVLTADELFQHRLIIPLRFGISHLSKNS
jgi:hypothetical protein